MSFPAYERYKESEVEWLGQVPSHWGVERLRFLVDLNPSKSEAAGLPADTELSFLPMEAIGEAGELDLSRTRPVSEVQAGYSYFADGDVVFAKVTPCFENGKGALMKGLSLGRGFGTTELTVLRPRQLSDGPFLRWLTFSRFFRDPATGEMTGAGGLKRVPDDFVADFRVPWPPAHERQAVSAFLDRETAKIDALVEAQRRLIELLKEKRQAVISHAVTKGLDPSAPMKDSGVEWMGQVPAHWKVSQSRRMFGVRSEQALPEDQMLTASQKYGVLFQADFVEREGRRVVEVIMGKDSLRHVEPDDFIISMRSFQGGLEWSLLRGATSFHYVMVTPIKWVHPPFFAHLFKSTSYIQALRATTDLIRDGQEIRYSHFVKVPLPVIPIEEQKRIADVLSAEVGRYDALLMEAEGHIALLQERRAALISAAVTGKIDVRPRQPEIVADRSRIRLLVAATVVGRLSHRQNFGRVKLQKLVYLAEAHVGVTELGGSYRRAAAGPLDWGMIEEMEASLEKSGCFAISQSDGKGGPVSYRVLGQPGVFRDEVRAVLGEREAQLVQIIDTFTDLDTKNTEAVATLYAAWNDLLQDGVAVSDDAIVSEVLTNWHPEKARKFKKTELTTWIQWMRGRGLTPRGAGPRTTSGRLFV